MTQPIIEIKNIRKRYDDRLVLDIPHLSFESGLIYALVGPNGSGKTTLLKLINLLESPTEGDILFNGQKADINSPNALELKRKMTLVMQNAVLFRTSVYKNIAYGLKFRFFDKAILHYAVTSALDMVGLAGFEQRKARKLSAGEAQRTALARAIVIKPDILILDEPTANVDRRNIQTIENLLKKINAEHGTTIIFTTHDLSQAYRMTKNVISLLDGKVISGGSENIIYGIFRQENGQKFINIAPNINIKVNNFNQDNVGIYISPNNIKVSLIPDYNDNRNCLKGHVASVTMLNGNVRLIIDTGIELISLISKEAFQEIASVAFTKDIYVIIDISDVHVF